LLAACNGRPVEERIVWRLVDSPSIEAVPRPFVEPAPAARFDQAPPAAPRGPSRAVIADDLRYTFTRPELRFVHRDVSFRVPPVASFPLDVGLPDGLQGCGQLEAEVTMTSAATTHVASVIGTCQGRRLVLDIAPPPSLRGASVDLWVHARPVPPFGIRQRRFFIDRVPEGARLTFSYGVESPGWEHDAAAATFHVLAQGDRAPLFAARLDPASNPAERRWFAGAIDLSSRAGKPLTLVLQLSVDRAADRRPFSSAVWGDPTLVARASAPAGGRPRNVLLVSLDAAAAPSVETAGGRAHAPSGFLDTLAAEGARFDDAVASSTSTPQAHLSLFTAVDASAHGLTDLGDGRSGDRDATMAELFRAAGYATAALTDGGLPAARGFERGFDRYLDADRQARAESPLRATAEWISSHRSEPFFLFVHTRGADDADAAPATERATAGGGNTAIAADLEHCNGAAGVMDDQLAALWREIRRLGLADATVAIAMSGGHAQMVRDAALHDGRSTDETVLGPLVIRAPGLVPPHTRVPQHVRLVDVLPTVLDLLRLPPVPRAEGRSLVALLDGRNAGAAEAATARSP
jgi:hypothetical protein